MNNIEDKKSILLLSEKTVLGLHSSLIRRLPDNVSHSSPILDLGCGSGAWLQRLSEDGFIDLTGLDRDMEEIQSNVGVYINSDLDGPDWGLPEKRFKLITAIEVIEHLGNIGWLLEQAEKVLADEGWILVTSPNIHSLPVRLRFMLTGDLKQFGKIGDTEHIFPIVLGSFPRLLKRYGLEIFEYWGYPEDGRTLTSRSLVNWVVRLFRLFLPEQLPGDVICMLIKRKGLV